MKDFTSEREQVRETFQYGEVLDVGVHMFPMSIFFNLLIISYNAERIKHPRCMFSVKLLAEHHQQPTDVLVYELQNLSS